MTIKLCSVATNQELFESFIFKTIGKKLEYDTYLFGNNIQWTGFKTKMKVFMDNLNQFHDEDLIICSDCYDVLPLRHSKEFELKVQKYLDRNIKIIISAEMFCLSNCVPLKEFKLKNKYFLETGLQYVNAGLIFGQCKYLKNMWTFLYNNYDDDQIGLSHYMNENPSIIYFDQLSDFFLTSACNKYIPRLENIDKNDSFFLHVPSLNQHKVQRHFYKQVLEKIATNLHVEHLTGPQSKISISERIEMYALPFILLLLMFVIFFKNKK